MVNGKLRRCDDCRGLGVVSYYSNVDFEGPEECVICGGSGSVWEYPNGALAKYYGGPFIGKLATPPEFDEG